MDQNLDLAFESLRESKGDGRAGYLRYRQRQILALYNAVSNNETDFVKALKQDTGKSDFEACLEVSLVLANLRYHFAASDFKTLTERVGALRKGGFIPTAHGAALVVGHWTAPLDSSIGPLSAAIAAGNVALTLLPNNARALSQLIQKCVFPSLDASAYPILLDSTGVLSQVLDQDFDVYSAVSTDKEFRHKLSDAAGRRGAPYHLLPKRLGQNICIVSKTTPVSDLGRVANLIVRSKFCALAGASLGAPAFICAHEEVHGDLVKHLTRAAKEVTAVDADFSQPPKSFVGQGAKSYGGEGKTVFKGQGALSDATIVEIVPFTSTEEALNLVANRLGHVLNVFADQLEIDYFATELKPELLTANDMPLELLTGLCSSAKRAEVRWELDGFEREITIRQVSGDNSALVPPFASWQIQAMRKAVLPSTAQELKLNLKKHSNIIRRVFFLQGLFLSLSVILGSVAVMGGFGGVRLYRYLFR